MTMREPAWRGKWGILLHFVGGGGPTIPRVSRVLEDGELQHSVMI